MPKLDLKLIILLILANMRMLLLNSTRTKLPLSMVASSLRVGSSLFEGGRGCLASDNGASLGGIERRASGAKSEDRDARVVHGDSIGLGSGARVVLSNIVLIIVDSRALGLVVADRVHGRWLLDGDAYWLAGDGAGDGNWLRAGLGWHNLISGLGEKVNSCSRRSFERSGLNVTGWHLLGFLGLFRLVIDNFLGDFVLGSSGSEVSIEDTIAGNEVRLHEGDGWLEVGVIEDISNLSNKLSALSTVILCLTPLHLHYESLYLRVQLFIRSCWFLSREDDAKSGVIAAAKARNLCSGGIGEGLA